VKDMIHVSQPHCAHFGYSLTEEGSVQLGWTSGEGKAMIGDCNGFIHHQMISPRNIPMAPYDPMDSAREFGSGGVTYIPRSLLMVCGLNARSPI
jgi:hypothetical protein